MLEDSVQTPVRSEPHISLEEVDSDEVVVRIQATPLDDSDGPRLADEVLSAVATITHEGQSLAMRDGRDDGERKDDGGERYDPETGGGYRPEDTTR